MSRRRRQVHLRHRGELNRRGRKLRRSMKELGAKGRIYAKARLVVEYQRAALGSLTGVTLYRSGAAEPDEVLAPGVDYRQREADRAAVRDAVRAAGGGQPWLLPSPEGLEAMGRAKRGPKGRPIPNNPSMRRKT